MMVVESRATPSKFWPIAVLNSVAPDHDYDSTVSNLAEEGASEDLACWLPMRIPVDGIHPYQLLDDPDNVEADAKVERIRELIRTRRSLPAVIVIHTPSSEFEFNLIEGQHRYNAAHREQAQTIFAWVAHIGCCGGPEPDLQ